MFGGTSDHPDKAVSLPSYVYNHGILKTTDLQSLLSRSRVFVGLGFPFEGPAPLEAIAQGCVFLNPRFAVPQNAVNNKFFRGKPTFREVGYCAGRCRVYGGCGVGVVYRGCVGVGVGSSVRVCVCVCIE